MTLAFQPDGHTYTWKGQAVPNVTRIIESLVDYSKIKAEVLEYKRELGGAVHDATHLDDLGTLDPESVDPRVAPYLEAWRKFKAESGFEVQFSELQCYSRQHGYACTLDRAGMLTRNLVNGAEPLALIEIKTTSELHPVVGVQLAGQLAALSDDHPEYRGALRYAVQLRPDGSYRGPELYGDRGDFSTFLSLLNIYRWRQRNG